VLTQKYPQWLQTATSSLWAIYMASPGHFGVAGVPRSHTYTQKHLQAIQKHSDQIFSPYHNSVSVCARLVIVRKMAPLSHYFVILVIE